MIAYHCDYNSVLVIPFKSCKDSNRILSYNETTTRLKQRNHLVYLQNLDNEASAEYKATMKYVWKAEYQLVPTNLHPRNVAERAICKFKA